VWQLPHVVRSQRRTQRRAANRSRIGTVRVSEHRREGKSGSALATAGSLAVDEAGRALGRGTLRLGMVATLNPRLGVH